MTAHGGKKSALFHIKHKINSVDKTLCVNIAASQMPPWSPSQNTDAIKYKTHNI